MAYLLGPVRQFATQYNRSTLVLGSALLGICFVAIGFASAQVVPAAGEARQQATTITTRLIPLYYARDVAEVIALVRGQLPRKVDTRSPHSSAELQQLAAERHRLYSERSALLSARHDEFGVQQIDQALARLDAREQFLRADAFRQGGKQLQAVSTDLAATGISPRRILQIK